MFQDCGQPRLGKRQIGGFGYQHLLSTAVDRPGLNMGNMRTITDKLQEDTRSARALNLRFAH